MNKPCGFAGFDIIGKLNAYNASNIGLFLFEVYVWLSVLSFVKIGMFAVPVIIYLCAIKDLLHDKPHVHIRFMANILKKPPIKSMSMLIGNRRCYISTVTWGFVISNIFNNYAIVHTYTLSWPLVCSNHFEMCSLITFTTPSTENTLWLSNSYATVPE